MTVLKVVLAIVGGLVALLVVLAVVSLVIDAFLRRRLDAHPYVDFEPGDESARTLIVYMPGILSGGRASSVDLLDVWLRYGDVVLVEYDNYRFDGPAVVGVVMRAIRWRLSEKDYDTVLFLGSSMGALLSYDVIKQGKLSRDVVVKFAPLDAPTSASDLYAIPSWAAPIAPLLIKVLAFGPIWNSFNLMAKMFVPPKEKNIEPGVDRIELARRVEEAKSYTISFWRDQLLYIVTHGAPALYSLEGLVDRLDFVRSTRDDDTVRPQAYDTWADTVPYSYKHEVDSTHVGFAERPETWRQAFEYVLDLMLRR